MIIQEKKLKRVLIEELEVVRQMTSGLGFLYKIAEEMETSVQQQELILTLEAMQLLLNNLVEYKGILVEDVVRGG